MVIHCTLTNLHMVWMGTMFVLRIASTTAHPPICWSRAADAPDKSECSPCGVDETTCCQGSVTSSACVKLNLVPSQ